MGGFSSVTGQQTTVFADNVSFDGTQRGGMVTTDGQLLIGSTALPHIKVGNLTSTGATIAITRTSGAINIDLAGGTGNVEWSTIDSNTVGAANKGYIAIAAGGALTISLPATSVVGDLFEAALDGATSWQITQAAGQQIRFGNTTTTLGVGGSITTAAQGDAIRLVCRAANTLWTSLSSMGSLTIV